MLARCVGVAVFAAAISFSARVSSAEPAPGYIHVRTTAGVSIKLDGKLKGVVENDEGFVIRDVPAGVHSVYAFMNGHEDQHAMIDVQPGAIAVVKLRPFQPVPEHKMLDAPSDARVKSGSLWVEAIAVHATIDSKQLGWKKIPLDGEPFVAANVPAGQHKITFCNPEKCMDYRANVKANDVLALVVDFGVSNIQDVTTTKKSQWARLRDACSVDRALCPSACNVELALAPNARSPACDVLGEQILATVTPVSAVEVSAVVTPPCVPIAGDKHGWLTIRTTPSAALFYGSRKLGDTPLSRVDLPAGCVELRAVSAGGLEKMLRVDLEADQVVVYAIEL